MISQVPEIAQLRNRILREWRRGVLLLDVIERQQFVDLVRVEAGEAQIKVRFLDLLEFQGKEFFVPVGPAYGPVHHQPKCFHMGSGPLVAEDDRDFRYPEFSRGLQTQVPVQHLAVAACENRNLESEFADAAAHAIHGGIVLSGISWVFDEPFDRPSFNALLHNRRNHASPCKIEMCEGSFGGCALRSPCEPNLPL